MKIKIIGLLTAVLLGIVTTNANALLIALGDSNATTTSGTFDNTTWYSNILGGGTDVLIRSGGLGAGGYTSMYNFLSVTNSATTATVTGALLTNIDLFISATTHIYSAAETTALSNFLQGGGAVLLQGEHSGFPAENASVNGLLTGLGSGMSLNPLTSLCGLNTLSGAQIANDPLNTGVTSFQMGCTSGILGGTPLLYTVPGQIAMAAYEGSINGGGNGQVPAPAPLALIMLGLSLLGWNQRRFRSS